jgi:hypothetical protein
MRDAPTVSEPRGKGQFARAPRFKISPHYDSTKLINASLDDFIDVYEDRTRGWLIDCARILNEHEHAGFGVLQIALSYFEAHTVFLRGEDSRNHARLFFKAGFEAAFPETTRWPQALRK